MEGSNREIDLSPEPRKELLALYLKSDKTGLVFRYRTGVLGAHEENVFLGREIGRHRQYGEATSARIDDAVRRVVLEGYRKARNILEDCQSTVVRLANALQESETLNWHQLETLIGSESRCGAGTTAVLQGCADRSPPLHLAPKA